jgi:hypothetical protein
MGEGENLHEVHGVVCDEEGKNRIGLRLCIVFAEDEMMRKCFMIGGASRVSV